MSLPHVKSGQVLDLMNLPSEMLGDSTFALVKTSQMEIIRMVLEEGKKIPQHKVVGESSVQCLQGKVIFKTEESEQTLEPGSWIYLDGSIPHSLEALANSVLLVTVLFEAH